MSYEERMRAEHGDPADVIAEARERERKHLARIAELEDDLASARDCQQDYYREMLRHRDRATIAAEWERKLREALAIEVEARRWRPISEWGSVPIGRLHEMGEEQRGTVWSRGIAARPDVPSHRWTHFRECLNGEPDHLRALLKEG